MLMLGRSIKSENNEQEMRPYSNQRGFTLIEMIMVIILISIIAGIAAMIILEGAKSYQKEVSFSDIHNQGRLAIERMAREIRMIRSATAADILGCCSTTDLVFCDVTGKAVEFQVSGTELRRRESAACSPLAWGTWNTLASNVVSGSTPFSYYQQNGTSSATLATEVWYIQIDLTTVNAGETLLLRVRVHPRNF